MNIRLQQGQLNNVCLDAISSKSHVHRLLIAAALSGNLENGCLIRSNIVSDDMKATVRCLSALGAVIDVVEEGFYVRNSVTSQGEVVLNCGESGSTARFLLPVSLLFSECVILNGEGKLPNRPFGPLNKTLRPAGIDISSDYLPLTAKGNLQSGDFLISGDVSSQFISGLLFALPLLKKDSTVTLTTPLQSKGYVDLTIDVLRTFGIRIDRTDKGYCIPGGQNYVAPTEITAEGDWSNSGFLLCAGALAKGISIKGLSLKSIQKDSLVTDILNKFGVKTEFDGKVSVLPSALTSIDVDAEDIPDLVPALCVVAAYADGTSRFRNVGRLRIKESDRIEAIQAFLREIDVKSSVEEADGQTNLLVFGKSHKEMQSEDTVGCKEDIEIDGFNDHRIVMAASMVSLREDRPVVIKGAQAVNKSYPGFFDVCTLIGINVTKAE